MIPTRAPRAKSKFSRVPTGVKDRRLTKMWKLAANLAKEEEQKKQEEAAEKEAQAEDDSTTPVVRVGSKDLSDSRKKLKEDQAKEQATKSVDIKKKTGNTRKRDPTDIRLMTELSNLDLTAVPGVEIFHPDKRNQKLFEVTLVPQDGLWKGAKFKFNVKTPNGYPHEAPNVTCDTRVYHPNIDLQGKVCSYFSYFFQFHFQYLTFDLITHNLRFA
jgi:hypothetical protein